MKTRLDVPSGATKRKLRPRISEAVKWSSSTVTPVTEPDRPVTLNGMSVTLSCWMSLVLPVKVNVPEFAMKDPCRKGDRHLLACSGRAGTNEIHFSTLRLDQ